MTPDFKSYYKIIVMFSGGKDSLGSLLHLIESGAPLDKIELWHHDIDGREGSSLMDWPVTRDYCRKVAAAFGLPIYFSWRVGGFEREMLREGTATAPVAFETPRDGVQQAGGKGPANTRRKFPQVSADLSVRWCSAYLKIDVCASALRNQERFIGRRTLVVTGERAEESKARAKYETFEPHRADTRKGRPSSRRHIDHWRPVHAWLETQVWETIQRHGVAPHPAYVVGWGRVSCAACIFGSPSQWASLRAIAPAQVAKIAGYEVAFGKTIQRKLTVIQSADKGTPYASMTPEAVSAALAETFTAPVRGNPADWRLPAGAYGESCGPT